MAQDSGNPTSRPPAAQTTGSGKAQVKAVRLAREAAALRGNLRKRKEQARQRVEPGGAPKAEG